MSARYELYLCTDRGDRLLLLSEYLQLSYQIVEQAAGFCHVVVPGSFDASFIRPDYKIAIWRQPEGGAMALEDVYMIRYFRRYTTSQGQHRYELVGANGNSILVDRTTIPSGSGALYYAGRYLDDYADDALKYIVREAMAYSFGAKAPYFSVQADSSQGASFKKIVGFRSLADEATARCSTSTGRGTTLLWHVVALSEVEYQLRTYLNQIGQNRTWPDGYNPILVTEENAMLGEAQYICDGIEMANYVYAVGALTGVEGTRQWNRALDRGSGAYNTLSVYSTRQKIVDCGNESDSAARQEEAYEALEESYPKETFTFKLKDTPHQRYGRDWRFGDRITAYYDKYYSCRIRGVTVNKASPNEPEEIQVDLDIVAVHNAETV